MLHQLSIIWKKVWFHSGWFAVSGRLPSTSVFFLKTFVGNFPKLKNKAAVILLYLNKKIVDSKVWTFSLSSSAEVYNAGLFRHGCLFTIIWTLAQCYDALNNSTRWIFAQTCFHTNWYYFYGRWVVITHSKPHFVDIY